GSGNCLIEICYARVDIRHPLFEAFAIDSGRRLIRELICYVLSLLIEPIHLPAKLTPCSTESLIHFVRIRNGLTVYGGIAPFECRGSRSCWSRWSRLLHSC